MASNNDVIEEIEALQAIMMDEVHVEYDQSGQPTSVQITIKPATAQNVEEQHVRVTLIVMLPQLYPDEPPKIILRNPRGIDDDVLQIIKFESNKKCEKFIGFPVIYELAELVREKLTANNTPSCPCAICLFYFTQHDHFTKTPCFHYFHSNCLGRYILNCEESAAVEEKENQQPLWMAREKRQLLCPICRESMDSLSEQINGQLLLRNPPPEESEMLEDFCPTSPDIVALQSKMTSLYLHQKSKGGIIDLEEEKNKFLVSAATSLVDIQDENLEECKEETPQASDCKDASTITPQKQSCNIRQNNTNKQVGESGSRNQIKKDNSSNQTWFSGRNKNSHKRGSRNNTNGYIRRQTYSYTDHSQLANTVQSQALDQKYSSNVKSQKSNNLDKHNQGRFKNPELKSSRDMNNSKYMSKSDIKDPRTEVNIERISVGDSRNMGQGQSNRNFSRGGRGKSNGSSPGFADLNLTFNTHAAS